MNARQPGRRSQRLANFDYTTSHAYFITICSANRQLLFGSIQNHQAVSSAVGTIVETCWRAIPGHFSNASVDAFVVMPNHVHGVVILGKGVEAECRHVTGRNELSTRPASFRPLVANGSIGAIVRSFKSAATRAVRECGLLNRDSLWQRNYYERVIRNEEELNRIRKYIADNPLNWDSDEDNPRHF